MNDGFASRKRICFKFFRKWFGRKCMWELMEYLYKKVFQLLKENHGRFFCCKKVIKMSSSNMYLNRRSVFYLGSIKSIKRNVAKSRKQIFITAFCLLPLHILWFLLCKKCKANADLVFVKLIKRLCMLCRVVKGR